MLLVEGAPEMVKSKVCLIAAAIALSLGIQTAWAQNLSNKEKAELAKALPSAKVPLERALLVSEHEGKPISAGFEIDQGELNLWVFVQKGDKFLEVTVNYKNGEIEEVEAITKADDLKDAKEQSQAMEKAKLSLRVALERAIKENPGYKAVEITPELENGRPIASITLVRGQEFKEVSQPLDSEERRSATEGNNFAAVEESEYDPWEPFNEKTFWFNRQLDRFILKPVATAYKKVLPDPVRKGIGNALDNLDVVRRLVNNLLQLRFDGAGREISRFVINSTVGMAGFFDIADQAFDIEPSNRDMGQTLGKYGIGSGPYLVLPFLPPLTVRDFFGFVADEAMYPLDYFVPIGASIGVNATEKVSERAENLDKFDGVEETVIDLYGAVRNAYLQRREADIRR